MQPDELNVQIRRLRKRPIFEAAPDSQVEIGQDQIKRLLPHRDPFLFVEAITHVDLAAGSLAGKRTIQPADPVFAGHFPGSPVYPGVLQMEMMGQHALCLLALGKIGKLEVPLDAEPPDVRALKIHHAVFVREIAPNDELTLLVDTVDANEYTAIAAGQVFRGDEICSYGLMEVYFVD